MAVSSFQACLAAASLLSTETCVALARRWEKRQGWSWTGHSVEYLAAQAMRDIVLGGHASKPIRKEVEDALNAARVALVMGGEA